MTADPVLPADLVRAIEHGLAVFDLPAGSKDCTPGWQQRCSNDLAVVRRWWRPGMNVGVGCRASGVVGIDLDRHDGRADGIATFAALCARHGQDWPVTLTIGTAHDGQHLYLRVPPSRIIGSASGDRSPLGPGIDIRGPGRRSGGYLVGPGSVVDGRPYVILRDTSIAELPAWLADLLEIGPTLEDPAHGHAGRVERGRRLAQLRVRVAGGQ